jgi:hypothetical protein
VEASLDLGPEQLKEDSGLLSRTTAAVIAFHTGSGDNLKDAAAVLTRPCTLERQTNADSGGKIARGELVWMVDK